MASPCAGTPALKNGDVNTVTVSSRVQRVKRCNKIIELKGGRFEPVHLKQIRKEMEAEDKERKKDEEIDSNYMKKKKKKKKKKMSQKL